jgi:hypothetical protein
MVQRLGRGNGVAGEAAGAHAPFQDRRLP